jgi:hypothetical protein
MNGTNYCLQEEPDGSYVLKPMQTQDDAMEPAPGKPNEPDDLKVED